MFGLRGLIVGLWLFVYSSIRLFVYSLVRLFVGSELNFNPRPRIPPASRLPSPVSQVPCKKQLAKGDYLV